MRTKSRIRKHGLVLAVLTFIVSVPELARAQQSGLFPLAPIKRQRVPCDQEDPVYKIYKEKYFGYHPPCWRPFPTGWGCPSPEKPDVEKSFREMKLGAGGNAPVGESDEMQQGEQPLGRPEIPDLPGGGRSPFEQPVPPGGDKPANPAAPRPGTSPFDLPAGAPANNPGAAPAAPRSGRVQPARPLTGEGSPELSAPEQPARLEGTQTSRTPRNDDGPLLSVGDITVPPVSDADDAFGAGPASSGTTTTDATPAQGAPASSPPRRGFLSGLFNNLGWNWTRR
jgi:hypothetical protein